MRIIKMTNILPIRSMSLPEALRLAIRTGARTIISTPNGFCVLAEGI